MTEPAAPMPPAPPPPAGGYTPSGPSGPRASFGQRLVAAIVDGIIVNSVTWVLIIVLAGPGDEGGAVLGYLIALVLAVGYFAYLEGGPTGQTLGKRVMSIRVIDANTGGPLGYGRGVGRYFARWISSIPCLLGYFWMLWDREKQTWHDKICTCVVVPTDAYPVR